MGWTVWVSNTGREKRRLFSSKRPDRLWNLQSSYSVDTDAHSSEISSKCVKSNTLLDLGLRLRTSGAILLLPLYVFVAWTEKTLPL